MIKPNYLRYQEQLAKNAKVKKNRMRNMNLEDSLLNDSSSQLNLGGALARHKTFEIDAVEIS